MKKDNTLYSEDSIKHLPAREFTRLRPSTYLGSNEYNTQLCREVFANAFDEHIIGHGNKIIVKIEDGVFSVQDFGQGFPINVKKGDSTVVQQSFDTINTSGKFDDDGIYGGSAIGLNGIGAKLTNFLSEYLTVMTIDGDGNYEYVEFKDGIFKKRKLGKTNEHSGTTVTWKPDGQFFQNNVADIKELKHYFEEVSALSSSLTIEFIVDGETTVFERKGGIEDLLWERVNSKQLFANIFSFKKELDGSLFDVALTYTTDYSCNISSYINYGATESGVHITAFKQCFTKSLNKYITDRNLLNKKESSLSFDELAEGLVVIFNLKANGVKYDAQVKTRVVDIDRTLLTQVMTGDFSQWLIDNEKCANLIVERAINARRARKAAADARDKMRSASSKQGRKKFIDLPTKLVDAWSKKREKCELYLCEGDSAGNGLVAKRKGEFQAIFPLRGKVLSCRKASKEKIYGNQEIANIVKALGLQIDEQSGKLIYEARRLRYGKIIIACDSDVDGYDIRRLLINMFWELCPELIINKHIYIAIPPLYRITTKDNQYVFLTGDKELTEYKNKHKKQSFLINRNKGLGEQSPDELEECLLDEKTRNIQLLFVDDVKLADDLLEITSGGAVEPRRDYLLQYYQDVQNGVVEKI